MEIKASNGKVGFQAESDRSFPARGKHEDKANGNTSYNTPVTKAREALLHQGTQHRGENNPSL